MNTVLYVNANIGFSENLFLVLSATVVANNDMDLLVDYKIINNFDAPVLVSSLTHTGPSQVTVRMVRPVFDAGSLKYETRSPRLVLACHEDFSKILN